jgi:ribosomal protein S18 acetylase RimI-like enzyme
MMSANNHAEGNRSTSAFVVRPGQAQDALPLARCHVETWRAGYQEIIDPALLASLSVEAFHDRWLPRLSDASSPVRILVGLDASSGELMGFSSFGPTRLPEESAGEVYALYVRRACWGTGLAERLLIDSLDSLRAQGFETALLNVLLNNRRARRFYEKHGFAWDGTAFYESRPPTALLEVRYRRTL